MLGEHAADDRTEDAADHPDAGEIGLVLAALARGDDVRDHGLHDRHDAAAAEALKPARQDQHRHVRRDRAQHRARDEQTERDDDHDAAAIDVAERAEHRRDRGRGEQVGRDHPGEIGDVLELAPDGRQRGRHDGLVERGEEHRQHQADDDGADLVGGQRHRRRDGRRVIDAQHLAGKAGKLVGNVVRQCLDVGSVLPFEFVHLDRSHVAAQRRVGFVLCNPM